MAIDLTPEQRETGKENFARTTEGLAQADAKRPTDPTRRSFMKGLLGATGAGVVTAGAYYGYKALGNGKPVKAALIGCGDEGGVLLGEHNPEFIQFVAACDIRPSNQRRIIQGDPKVALRKGFTKIYGADYANEINKKHFYADYQKMLRDNPEIEAVVIALPLHWHAKCAVDCMRIGKERGRPVHVLCEKLMGWNISQCKQMIQAAKETGSILSIGHQRHYSLLYAHAQEVLASGVIGDVKHIRALWHRNNTWPFKVDEKEKDLLQPGTNPQLRDGWFPAIYKEDYDKLHEKIKEYGYDDVEQLVRWRLYNETGGGLMAELGSHQLDASSIFLGKVHPLAVTGIGGTYFYGKRNASGKIERNGDNARQSDDHVFVTYEFPGKKYHPKDNPDDIVVVTYSSINSNGFEEYGETVMGTRGTLIVEKETTLMLYPEKAPGGPPKAAGSIAVGVSTTGSGAPALDASSTWGGPTTRPAGTAAAGPGGAPVSVSRGYREEMEDFAYCIRLWDAKLGYQEKPESDRKDKKDRYVQRLPRCHGEVAMADAIIALSANRSMRLKQRLEFDPRWFEMTDYEMNSGKFNVPDGDTTKTKVPVE